MRLGESVRREEGAYFLYETDEPRSRCLSAVRPDDGRAAETVSKPLWRSMGYHVKRVLFGGVCPRG